MKLRLSRKTVCLLMACLCVFALFQKSHAETLPPQFKVGETISLPGLNLPQEMKVIAIQKADITGDGAEDDVLLVGKTLPDNPAFYDQLSVVVRDGKSGKLSVLPDGKNKQYLRGYEPKLFLGDFTGDKLSDVMVTLATGGSGGTYNHLIASWRNNRPAVIFGETENEGLKIKGKYLDGFKAELFSAVLNKTFMVDVSGFKRTFIQANVYDESGKYIYVNPYRGKNAQQYDIFSDPFFSLVPVDVNSDGVYELQGKQNVWGPFHVFTITTVTSLWKYKNGKWNVTDAEYTLTYDIINGK